MGHEMPDQHPLLAVLRKFRPVVGDRRIEIKEPSVGKHERTKKGHSLGAAVDIDNGVLLPRDLPLRVEVPSPDVDDHLTVDADRKACSHILTARYVLCELVAHCVKARVPISSYFRHGVPLLLG